MFLVEGNLFLYHLTVEWSQRAEVEHSHVKAVPPGGAGLKKDIGKSICDTAQEVIQTKNITMGKLALMFC